MLLKTVRIQNFRCFREVEVSLDNTTVLIGENNAGKTSFLEAIRLCLSRNITRREAVLEDYDYHLASKTAQPEQAEELKISLDFETGDNPPSELVQALGDIHVIDDEDKGHVIIQVTSKFDPALKDWISEWSFLDCDGNSLPPKTKRPQSLNTFLQLTPVFYLSALRDAAREFQRRSMFWGPFLRNPGISDEVREKLQSEISSLNNDILKAHTSLQSVRTHLEKIQNVVAAGEFGGVDIEALPARITDLLARTQINITAPTGASLPLERHGLGTQSLSVIFLFEAFLESVLNKEYDELSKPILTLEEPETHLHPSAARSVWTALEAISGQKIIATHSGDLLSRVPLGSIRRFYRKNGVVGIRQLRAGTLVPDELRKVEFHLLSSRGELLFARCWLLVEGESEYWLFHGVADILGFDFDRFGVRVVNTRLSGVEPLVKVANDFGIDWCFVGDGDVQGKSDLKACENNLQGRKPKDHLYVLKQANIEVFLSEEGFGYIFEKHISEQKRHNVTAKKGLGRYWEQVVDAQPNKQKPERIREVVAEMKARGEKSVPTELAKIIKATMSLAESFT